MPIYYFKRLYPLLIDCFAPFHYEYLVFLELKALIRHFLTDIFTYLLLIPNTNTNIRLAASIPTVNIGDGSTLPIALIMKYLIINAYSTAATATFLSVASTAGTARRNITGRRKSLIAIEAAPAAVR